jgi:hypothetical protein
MKPQQLCRITVILLVAGTCLFTGCAKMAGTGRHTSFTIKVVDERNNRPIPDVSAVWREDLDDLILGHFQIGPTNLQPSDDAGIIKIRPAREKMIGRLILSRSGSVTLYCTYAYGRLWYSRGIKPIAFPPPYEGMFSLSDPETQALWRNGSFVVPMPGDAQ